MDELDGQKQRFPQYKVTRNLYTVLYYLPHFSVRAVFLILLVESNGIEF